MFCSRIYVFNSFPWNIYFWFCFVFRIFHSSTGWWFVWVSPPWKSLCIDRFILMDFFFRGLFFLLFWTGRILNMNISPSWNLNFNSPYCGRLHLSLDPTPIGLIHFFLPFFSSSHPHSLVSHDTLPLFASFLLLLLLLCLFVCYFFHFSLIRGKLVFILYVRTKMHNGNLFSSCM